jgi:hypothetical protein
MAFLTNPISQPSSDISPILFPLFSNEVPTHTDQYDVTNSSQVPLGFSLECSQMTHSPQMVLVVGTKSVSLFVDLVCLLDLQQKFLSPVVSNFTSVYALSQSSLHIFHLRGLRCS